MRDLVGILMALAAVGMMLAAAYMLAPAACLFLAGMMLAGLAKAVLE